MAPRSTALPSAQTESARELRRNFFCELCSKGYARITEFESHENSYDHQHRKRMKEMKQITRNPTAAVRATRQDKKRTENAGMISLNLNKVPSTESKTGDRPRGFRDIGASQVELPSAPVPDAVPRGFATEAGDSSVKEVVEIKRPLRWEDLACLDEKLDGSDLPAEWQKQSATATETYLDNVVDTEKRRLYFDDDEDILDELGIGHDQWAAVSEPSQARADTDMDLDDDWEDFMQTDEWKRQQNEAEALRREKIVQTWKQRQQQQHPV